MYYDFFGFREPPFSIAPDPRYLYLSERHKEALAHLMYGVQGQGGFIVVTGEVGTGKTTVSRCFIENVPAHVDIALILNPKLSARELLSSICDELGIRHPAGSSIKRLIDLINADLLAAHAAGRHKVLMIDEAQNLSPEVLEQLRLLTNLETAEKKLLQIVLLGQPELQDMLSRPELRQLSQRVTARYHLDALDRKELPAYLRYRLSVAGQRSDLFSPGAIKKLYRLSGGVPRLINLISDRALLGAYANGEHRVEADHVKGAAREVLGKPVKGGSGSGLTPGMRYATLAASIGAAIVLTIAFMDRNGVVAENAEAPALSGTIERSPDSSQREPAPVPELEPEPAIASALVREANGESDEAAVGDFNPESDAMALAPAYEALFQAWELDYDPSEQPLACEFAESRGLRCLHREGSWRSLERLNHPAILDLRELGGDKRFVTLLGIEDDQAVIDTAAGTRWVSVAQIQEYWLGGYSIVWQLPPYLSRGAEPGAADREALWLTARMMQLIDMHSPDAEQRRDIENMNQSDQIRWYQAFKGLEVDGIAGAMTLIQMNNDLDSDAPQLSAEREPG
ncbi:AAA family ATPase [Marinobacter salicampi]|uniref:AAA family ATPase n=1 Tax=Marinobacter salicampi TaxID=435907 RepID=UPI00140B6CF5|nr:AAA family ATPase [Marinobacter salicampi]